MTNSASENPTHAEMWFDPLCPWAWMTSRWLINAAEVRNLEITWSVMSLSVLNEGRDLPEGYRAMLDAGWGPVRTIIAATKDLDADEANRVRKAMYDAYGQRIHLEGRREEGLDVLTAEVLAEVGLDSELAQRADHSASDDIDTALRASHDRAIELVGDEVGTPVVAVEGTAFFGPVVTPAPKGEDAGKLWDGCLLVAGTPGFYEIKRTRTKGPDFS